MVQINSKNMDCSVIVAKNRTVKLRELLPQHWLSE